LKYVECKKPWNHDLDFINGNYPIVRYRDAQIRKKHGGVYPVGLSFGFSRDGFIQTYPIPSNEKNHQPPVPYKSRHNWVFFTEKLHFQTQTVGESKSLMMNPHYPQKNIIVLPIVDG
jgi:hypothetical protein